MHRVAFIICTNKELLLKECLFYINNLYVPSDVLVDVFTITEAKSMTSGYNEAMENVVADIKIYMHQDVFIINRFFLQDLIAIFDSDTKIGMVGLVGYKKMSHTGAMWYETRYGCSPLYGASENYKEMYCENYRYNMDDGIEDVAVCDGCLLATSKDIRWDEENFDAWDFYDADQCIEYLKHGYRVVVPVEKYPWFVHDDGLFLNMKNYKKYRERFMNKHPEVLGKEWSEIIKN